MKKKLPIIFQAEPAECGLASLAMILQYHQRFVSLHELRQHYPVNLSGISLSNLLFIANVFQLEARVIRVEPETLKKVDLPAILHWNMNHFVVLSKIRRHKFIIHDPARGVVKESIESLSNSFTGMVLECHDIKKIKLAAPITKKNNMMEILKSIPGIKLLVVKFAILSLFYNIFLLISPRFLRGVIDNSVSYEGFSNLLALGFGFVWLRILTTIAKCAKDFCLVKLDADVSQALGESVVSKIIYSPLNYFEKQHLSDIIHRTNSIEQIRQFLFNGLIHGCLEGVLSILLLGYMFYYSSFLTYFSLCILIFIIPIKLIFISQAISKTQTMILNKSEEQAVLLENLRAIQPIKLFMKEIDRYALWAKKYKKFLASACRLSSIKTWSDSIKDLLLGLDVCVLMIVAAYTLQHKYISVGMLYVFLFYRQLFLDAFFHFLDKINDFKLLGMHHQRLEGLLEPSFLMERPVSSGIPDNFSLEVKNLSFQYSVFERTIINNLTFSIQQGECVVFVGPSGVGKSTLLKLLMGVLMPTEGGVLVGGLAASSPECRRHFASVMQQDQLLNGTIAENISFFSKDADLSKISYFATLAGIYDEIMQMPLGFQTVVGDLGANLSGGQKQRVLLARALYAKPRVLFLDEATSHLDAEKEREVNLSIKSLGITRVMIAHRQETIKMADRVISL